MILKLAYRALAKLAIVGIIGIVAYFLTKFAFQCNEYVNSYIFNIFNMKDSFITNNIVYDVLSLITLGLKYIIGFIIIILSLFNIGLILSRDDIIETCRALFLSNTMIVSAFIMLLVLNVPVLILLILFIIIFSISNK
jgi:hypothetical protein